MVITIGLPTSDHDAIVEIANHFARVPVDISDLKEAQIWVVEFNHLTSVMLPC